MLTNTRVAAFAAAVTGLAATLAVTTPAYAQPNCNVPVPPPICDHDPGDPPAPTTHSPNLIIDGAQQTTDRAAVHVWGWTTDADAPATALSVTFAVDGASRGSATANRTRSDVGAHGFDVTLPASNAGHNVCVTAVSVGGGANRNICAQMDDITGFEANDISYDTSRAVLTNQTLEQLDKVTNVNNTTVQQSTEISGSKSTSDTKGWSSTEAASISVSTSIKVGFPFFAEGKITVTATGSLSFTQNGSTTTSQTFNWRQPVLVPARSRVEATVAITHFTISVPYALLGSFVYRSGARAGGTVGGVFTGGNSENLVVNLQQFNLDGSPAAAPVTQPAATLLKASPAR